MMEIFVNGRLAAIKKESSFEYVSENRLFSGADGYTMSIIFPLKDCPENQAIFGHINRADVAAQKVVFNCEIRDRDFVKYGCITINEISDVEAKVQFLDGRSEQNFDKTLAETYINELNLGYPDRSLTISPQEAWSTGASTLSAVALPWVTESSENVQNEIASGMDNGQPVRRWKDGQQGLSWQPYLLHIAKQICAAIDYSCDFSPWENDPELKFLLVCNTLPYAWQMPNFARALPHWTVEEFFAQLELLLGCEIDIDHREQSITMSFSSDAVSGIAPVELTDVVDEFSSEIRVEDKNCDYVEATNLKYKDGNNRMWPYDCCPWVMKLVGDEIKVKSFDRLVDLIWWAQDAAEGNPYLWVYRKFDGLLYAADVDAYFLVIGYSVIVDGANDVRVWRRELRQINAFGPRLISYDEDAKETEISIVPADIDYIDENYVSKCLTLPSLGEYDGMDGEYVMTAEGVGVIVGPPPENQYISIAEQLINKGEPGSVAEHFDRIYIAFWNGEWPLGHSRLPYPLTHDLEIVPEYNGNQAHYVKYPFSLRLNSRGGIRKAVGPAVEPSQKTTFKFLAKRIPDVRAVFHIKGKRYICEKITATFTENGMSELMKGVFWPVKE